MIDLQQVWLTSISPKILNLRFSLHKVKDDCPPTGMTDEYHTYDLNLRFSLDMVKDDWPSQVWLTSISPNILKLRFSLDMVRDDWPATGMIDQYLN